MESDASSSNELHELQRRNAELEAEVARLSRQVGRVSAERGVLEMLGCGMARNLD